jgi:putative ABC transport system substrate-binding protein
MASYIGRRKFLATLGGAAAAWPLVARAQQGERVRRIGVLMVLAENDPEAQRRIAIIQKGLQEFGWIDGRNIRIDFRWTAGDSDRLRTHAKELVGLSPDVILSGSTAALAALHRETRTVPIVFAQVTDPVGAGFVASLAHPGGNITGFANYEVGIGVKWLELLKQIAPDVSRVEIIYDPANPLAAELIRSIDTGAPSLAVQVSSSAIRNSADIERAINALADQRNGGLVVFATPLTGVHRDVIIGLAARHRLPAVYGFRYFVESGGLASYGIDNNDLYRRAVSYVDRVLKGEKTADLPIQYATKFELVINLRTAKALGLDVPIPVLARTDEVIE